MCKWIKQRSTMVSRTYSLLLFSLLLVGLSALGPVGSVNTLVILGLLGGLGGGSDCLALVGGSDYGVVESEECQRSVSGECDFEV